LLKSHHRRTGTTLRINEKLFAHLAGETPATHDKAIIDDKTSPDAGTHSHVEHVLGSSTCSVAMLAQRGQLSIIRKEERESKLRLEEFSQRDSSEVGKIPRFMNQARRWIHWSGDTDRDSNNVGAPG
jgi:hypothetical protein